MRNSKTKLTSADLEADPEVTGFLNPQPLPPKPNPEQFVTFVLPHDWGYAKQWSRLEFVRSNTIIWQYGARQA
jgi:hypothetical protein